MNDKVKAIYYFISDTHWWKIEDFSGMYYLTLRQLNIKPRGIKDKIKMAVSWVSWW